MEQTLGKSESDSRIELDEESRRRLESLGYVTGTGLSEDFEFDQSKDDPKDLIDFHLDHGKIAGLVLAKKYEEAKAICEKLLSQRPQLPQIHIQMGEIAVDQNDFGAAANCFHKAVALNPQSPEAHRSMATALAQQGKTDEAVEHYEDSLQIKPDQPVVLDSLARLYHRRGKYERALNLWEEALRLKPESPDVLNNLAWLKAAYAEESFYAPDEAIEVAERACELTDYRSVSILDTLAVAYAAGGDFAKAVKIAESALQLAGSEDQDELRAQIQQHVELFKSGRPYRERRQSKSTPRQ